MREVSPQLELELIFIDPIIGLRVAILFPLRIHSLLYVITFLNGCLYYFCRVAHLCTTRCCPSKPVKGTSQFESFDIWTATKYSTFFLVSPKNLVIYGKLRRQVDVHMQAQGCHDSQNGRKRLRLARPLAHRPLTHRPCHSDETDLEAIKARIA